MTEALNAPAVREKRAAQIMEPIPTTSEQFRAHIEAEVARWTPVVKAANIRVN